MNSGEANYEFVPIQSAVARSLMLIVIKPPPLRSDGWPAASAVGETLRQGVGARSFVKLWARKSNRTDEREVAAATIRYLTSLSDSADMRPGLPGFVPV